VKLERNKMPTPDLGNLQRDFQERRETNNTVVSKESRPISETDSNKNYNQVQKRPGTQVRTTRTRIFSRGDDSGGQRVKMQKKSLQLDP